MTTVFDSLTVTDLKVLGRLWTSAPGPDLDGLFSPVPPAVPDSEATTVRQLVSDHNTLLAALRKAGVLAGGETT